MPAVRLKDLDGYPSWAAAIVRAIHTDNPGSTTSKVGVDYVVEHPSKLVINHQSVQAAVANYLPTMEQRHWGKLKLACDGALKDTATGWKLT
jgi:hypothetical protein